MYRFFNISFCFTCLAYRMKFYRINFQSLVCRSNNNKLKMMAEEDDFGLISVKTALNGEKIKLWLAPYYENNKDVSDSLNALAETLSGRLGMAKERIFNYLKVLQEKSVENLKDKESFEESGLARLKIRAPRREGNAMSLKIALTLNGKDLKTMVSEYYQLPIYKIKLISQGQLIKDDLSLESQGIKNGSHIMTLLISSNQSDMAMFESNYSVLNKTKEDVMYLTTKKHEEGDFYLQITDQSGKQLDLPKKERKALVMAMTLHEKGRAALKSNSFDLALLLLLEAEQEFKQCNSQLLQNVDNYGLLSLDLTWCYLNLNSISQLPNARMRLDECEKSFHKSYGSNLERLVALKGSSGNEAALFLRLHLLQAVVLYHQGMLDAATKLFRQVEAELKGLKVDDEQLRHLVEFGYTTHDARLALRETKGDVNLAAVIIDNKIAERGRVQEENQKMRQLKRLEGSLGKCKDGNPVDVQQHNALISMGYDFQTAKLALAETNNNINDALSVIQEHPERLFTAGVDDVTLTEIISMGFDCVAATAALQKHNGNKDLAVKELLKRNDVANPEASTSGKKMKTEKDFKLEKKALSRVADGIAEEMDDYLDLTLAAEETFLRKYLAYIDCDK